MAKYRCEEHVISTLTNFLWLVVSYVGQYKKERRVSTWPDPGQKMCKNPESLTELGRKRYQKVKKQQNKKLRNSVTFKGILTGASLVRSKRFLLLFVNSLFICMGQDRG